MKILSISEGNKVIGSESLEAFVDARSGSLTAASFFIPGDSGKKTALARLVPRLPGSTVPLVLWITGWGVWPSSENWDLFYGYRRSLGENRHLIDAPVHVVEAADSEALASILSMVFFFGWDAQLMNTTGEFMVTISHDEWLEVRTASGAAQQDAVQVLQRFGLQKLTAEAIR